MITVLDIDLYDKGLTAVTKEIVNTCEVDKDKTNLCISASDAHVLVTSKKNKDFNLGEVVVIKYPSSEQTSLKRIVGLPGEKVQIKDGNVVIFNKQYPNGHNLNESYLNDNVKTYGLSEDVITLSDDEYYVLGDNRNASKDSRVIGALNKENIIGNAMKVDISN